MAFQTVPTLPAQASTDIETVINNSTIDLAQTDNGQFCYLVQNTDVANDVAVFVQQSNDGITWYTDPVVPFTIVVTHATSFFITNNVLQGVVTTLRYVQLSIKSNVAGMPGNITVIGGFAK